MGGIKKFVVFCLPLPLRIGEGHVVSTSFKPEFLYYANTEFLIEVKQKLTHIQYMVGFDFGFKGDLISRVIFFSFSSKEWFNKNKNIFLYNHIDMRGLEKRQHFNPWQPLIAEDLTSFSLNYDNRLCVDIRNKINLNGNTKLIDMHSRNVISKYHANFDHLNSCMVKQCKKCIHILEFIKNIDFNFYNQFYII